MLIILTLNVLFSRSDGKGDSIVEQLDQMVVTSQRFREQGNQLLRLLKVIACQQYFLKHFKYSCRSGVTCLNMWKRLPLLL